MRIVLFGGTTEGRVLAGELAQRGHALTVAVATPVGADELRGQLGQGTTDVVLHVGRLDARDMAEFVAGHELCIDATHPYAREASENIRQACAKTGVPLRRVLRAASSAAGCIVVASAGEAAAYLAQTDGAVLLAIGAKELEAFACIDPGRLVVRVLPTHEAIDACERLGVDRRRIIALMGPFSREFNELIMREHGIRWLVTKDGGRVGGFDEKVAATRAVGAEVILIARPDEAGVSVEELLAELED